MIPHFPRYLIVLTLSTVFLSTCCIAGRSIQDPNGVSVPVNSWTGWLEGGNTDKAAVVVLPSSWDDLTILHLEAGALYQFVTDYHITNHWVYGQHTYLYFIPKNLQPYLVGVEGDTEIRMCLTSGGRLSTEFNIVWMETKNGNGTSGLIRFETTDTNPPLDTAVCKE